MPRLSFDVYYQSFTPVNITKAILNTGVLIRRSSLSLILLPLSSSTENQPSTLITKEIQLPTTQKQNQTEEAVVLFIKTNRRDYQESYKQTIRKLI